MHATNMKPEGPREELLAGCLPIILEFFYYFASFVGSISICYVVFLEPDMGLVPKLYPVAWQLIHSDNLLITILGGALLVALSFAGLVLVFALGYTAWFFMAYPGVIISRAFASRVIKTTKRVSTWFMASTLLLPPLYFVLGMMGIGNSANNFVLSLVMMLGAGITALLFGLLGRGSATRSLLESVGEKWMGLLLRTKIRAALSVLVGMLFFFYLYWLCWSSGMFANLLGAIAWHISLFYTITITVVWSNILAREEH
ncbi:MAG: hypothetical protein ABIN66_04125 [candidate division WOR-3 bacterium]